MPLALTEVGDRVLLPVRVRPRGGRSAVTGIGATGALEVRIGAPPVDGAANGELLRFLGREVLRMAPSTLEVVRGERGRDKVVAVPGLSADEVRRRVEAATG